MFTVSISKHIDEQSLIFKTVKFLQRVRPIAEILDSLTTKGQGLIQPIRSTYFSLHNSIMNLSKLIRAMFKPKRHLFR